MNTDENMAAMDKLWDFIRALFRHWWQKMSCAIFTLLTFYVARTDQTNDWTARAIVAVAILCLLAAAYGAWSDERDKVLKIEAESVAKSPRMVIKVVVDGSDSKAPVKIQVANEGESEMYQVRLHSFTVGSREVSFTDMIAVIPAKSQSAELLPQIQGYAVRAHNLPHAMMEDWERQGGLHADKLIFHASGEYEDHNHNQFKVQWLYEFEPHKFRRHTSKAGEAINTIADASAIFLVASSYATVRVARQP